MSDIYPLMAKFIHGNASPMEAEIITDWLNKNPKNKKEYLLLQDLLLITDETNQPQAIDINLEWKKFLPSTRRNPTISNLFYKTAVTIGGIILLYLGYRLYHSNTVAFPKPTPITKTTTIKSSADSSRMLIIYGNQITLDTNSSITFSRNEKNGKVVLNFKGSVYFDKKTQNNTPPIILPDSIALAPTGPSQFFIKSIDKSPLTELQVQSGVVQIIRKKDTVTVTARHGFSITKDSMQSIAFTPNIYGYATHIFEFTDTPLSTVISDLEKCFQVKISLSNPALKNCRITSLFEHKRLEEIIDIIAKTLNLETEYSNGNKQIMLSGNGCFQ